jgi:hypothetical protein
LLISRTTRQGAPTVIPPIMPRTKRHLHAVRDDSNAVDDKSDGRHRRTDHRGNGERAPLLRGQPERRWIGASQADDHQAKEPDEESAQQNAGRVGREGDGHPPAPKS